AGYEYLEFDTIERRWKALDMLSERSLPDSGEDKVYRACVEIYDAPHAAFVKRRNKKILSVPKPKGADETDLPDSVKEARSIAIQELLDTRTLVRKLTPDLVLSPADMPVPMKGEPGKAQKIALAWIKRNLGPLFAQPEQASDTNDEE